MHKFACKTGVMPATSCAVQQWASATGTPVCAIISGSQEIHTTSAIGYSATCWWCMSSIGTHAGGILPGLDKCVVVCCWLQVSPPFDTAEFDILYGEGINAVGCVFDVAKDLGVLEARVRAASSTELHQFPLVPYV